MPKMNLISNSGKKVSFTFTDDIVGKTMFDVINKREKNIRASHNSFSMFADTEKIETQLRHKVEKISSYNIDMPKIPKKLPCLDVSGEDNPLNAKINNTPEIK